MDCATTLESPSSTRAAQVTVQSSPTHPHPSPPRPHCRHRRARRAGWTPPRRPARRGVDPKVAAAALREPFTLLHFNDVCVLLSLPPRTRGGRSLRSLRLLQSSALDRGLAHLLCRPQCHSPASACRAPLTGSLACSVSLLGFGCMAAPRRLLTADREPWRSAAGTRLSRGAPTRAEGRPASWPRCVLPLLPWHPPSAALVALT